MFPSPFLCFCNVCCLLQAEKSKSKKDAVKPGKKEKETRTKMGIPDDALWVKTHIFSPCARMESVT